MKSFEDYLVVCSGFSRANAKIACSLINSNLLTQDEKYALDLLRFNLYNDTRADTLAEILESLNYRITKALGGLSVDKFNRRRI